MRQVKTGVSILGLLLLSLTGLALGTFSLKEQLNQASLIGVFFLLFLFSMYGLTSLSIGKQEWQQRKNNEHRLSMMREIVIFGSVVTGAIVTFYLNHWLDFGGVLASSIVGLGSGILFKKQAIALYCGSFVGMACNEIFSDSSHFLMAASISGLLFLLSQPYFNGFGGKLGTIAFFGTGLASLLINQPLRWLEPLASRFLPAIGMYAFIAALLTFSLKYKFHWNAVVASAVVGLFFGLSLPLVHGDIGATYAVAAFCGSFTGMSSTERLKTRTSWLVASFLTAGLFVFTVSYFDGSGGKLGTVAFISSIVTYGLMDQKKQLNKNYEK